jgi:hypothetical protein
MVDPKYKYFGKLKPNGTEPGNWKVGNKAFYLDPMSNVGINNALKRAAKKGFSASVWLRDDVYLMGIKINQGSAL